MAKEKMFQAWCEGCKFRLVPSECLPCIRKIIGPIPEPPGYCKKVKA